ncbi:MAG: bifunctional precorrin-2 dehydrogenase/sirohydrochlorin ferrochelatase, partial [Dehalococcoidia bacterium]|nr:bifunctional precorrin-2 dehydrogenase/sirohydrochlorin ferrochelatase [Dehalococcoidia bacterium]
RKKKSGTFPRSFNERMPKYYPIFVDIEGRRCLVVGGGEVAERKVESLLQCGARVTVVSPRLTEGLSAFKKSGAIDVHLREYRDGDTKGVVLVIAATDDNGVNAIVSREGSGAGIPVNVVDDPDKSTFIVPSVFKRGDIAIAISTGGKSPALARRMRVELEKVFPVELSQLAQVLADIRADFKGRGISADGEAWQDALDIDVLLELLRQGKSGEARDRITDRLLENEQTAHSKRG